MNPLLRLLGSTETILPRIFGIVGIELAQPCADIVSTVISVAVTEVYLAKLKKIPDGQMI